MCVRVCVHHHPPFSVWRSQTQTDELESEAISPSVFDPLEDWQAPPAVADFLARVGPMMNAQLARNATSHAFDGNTTNTNTQSYADTQSNTKCAIADYNLFTSDESDQVECLHTLQHAWPQPQEEEGAGHADGEGALLLLLSHLCDTLTRTLFANAAQDGAVTTAELPCTGISWTATGSTLCAS